MGEAKWKVHERRIARALGGERVPVTGKRGPDVVAGPWVCEVKTRRSLPKWLLAAIAQAEAAAKETGRTPLVVLLHAPGQGRKARRYALMPLEALVAERRESDDGKEVTS